MPEQLSPDEISGGHSDAEPSGDTGANNARWVVIGFVALITAFVLYMALGMPGMSHDGGGGVDHDMDNMDSGEMMP